ncbi:MAG TPA: hypothetical protein VK166_16810 [Chitinophagaceae bacterium]|nr:hypothetical protein [Chitinophagaceae bacterium]
MMSDRKIGYIEWTLIFVFSLFPVFLSFPYRVNIFLSWEGAYRLSEGQIPFRDFGIPLGYMFWVVPALFFKIFGPSLVTLVKAQAFINIISGIAFRSILKSFSVTPGVRLVSVIVYLLSFSFINFWPWYNHTVIVYEIVALAFLSYYLLQRRKTVWLVLAGVFSFISFFTKQDAGGLCFIFCIILLLYDYWLEGKWQSLPIYLLSFFVMAAIIILPLFRYEFTYWYNMGQAPHSSRFNISDFLDDILLRSHGLKLSLMMVVAAGILVWYNDRELLKNKVKILHLLLTLGILTQAAILQVTSYTPPNNNIYFQAFAFAYLFTVMARFLPGPWTKPIPIMLMIAAVFLWKSELYGGYLGRMLSAVKNTGEATSATGENLVNRSNYLVMRPTPDIPEYMWKRVDKGLFRNMRMPEPTIKGMERLLAMDLMKKRDLKVLNMSELTPLAAEVPFELEKGSDHPLWYHLGVGMFNREAGMFESRIARKYYDLVLFESVPGLNNFYPYRVRDSIQLHYNKVDSFYAPRRGPETMGMIEVYVR